MAAAVPNIPILETKLCPASGAADLIAREQLEPPLAFVEGRVRVATVTAPAGYGKSTLMADWYTRIAQQGIATSWLNLDDDDNDPTRFTRYLTAALIRGGLDIQASDLFTGSDGAFARDSRSTLESLAGELAAAENRIVLFIDDLHFIHNTEILKILQWLTQYAPPQLQFVLGSRTESMLPLSRLRVRRALVEYGPEQLKFSAPEVATFINARLGCVLSADSIQLLSTRTEGWPAGLELATLILDDSPDPDKLVADFAGNDAGVMDYLGEVLLENLDAETRQFIFAIAQFNRVDAELVTAATGATHATRQLEALHARNLFFKRMDASGHWFRFHHLVGQFFREQGLRLHPEFCRQALIKGARNLYARKLVIESIHYAMRAQAWADASSWLDATVESLVFRRGYLHTIMEWMGQLPAEWARQHPRIRINYIFALIFFARPQTVEVQLQILRDQLAELRLAATPDQGLVRTLECEIGKHECHLAGISDDKDAMLQNCQEWLQRWPDDTEEGIGTVLNVYAFALKSHSRIDEALQVVADAKTRLIATESHYPLAWSYTIEGFIQLKRGDFESARDTALELIEHTQTHMPGLYQHAGIGHAILAFIEYEWGNLEAARRHLEAVPENEDDYLQADYLIVQHLAQARLYHASGGTDTGYTCLKKGQERARRTGLHRAELTLATEEISWLCRDNRFEQAHARARQLGLDQGPCDQHDFSLQAEKSYRVASRLHLSDAPAQAAECLKAAIDHSRELQLFHRQAQLLLLQAQAYALARDEAAALAVMEEALMLGAQHQYFRIYIDEGALVTQLLQGLKLRPEHRAAAPLLRKIQQASAPPAPRKTGSNHSPGVLLEELTQRESQILKRLQSGLSNREIAEAIFVSEGTLKWHLHNIYGKLAVKNRSGALARAHELGLI